MATPKDTKPPAPAPVEAPAESTAPDPLVQVALLKEENELLARRQRELEARVAAAGIVTSPTAEAPRVPIAVEGSVDFDVTAMEAESTRRNLVYLETVELVRDQLQTGRFANVPDALARRNFHFVRVGMKGVPRAELKAKILREKGYVDAPRGVRAIGKGFENDGESAIILCASQAAHQRLLADKAARTRTRIDRLHSSRQKEIEDKLRKSLPKGTDVHVALKIGAGSGGLGHVDQEIAAAMRDMPRS